MCGVNTRMLFPVDGEKEVNVYLFEIGEPLPMAVHIRNPFDGRSWHWHVVWDDIT